MFPYIVMFCNKLVFYHENKCVLLRGREVTGYAIPLPRSGNSASRSLSPLHHQTGYDLGMTRLLPLMTRTMIIKQPPRREEGSRPWQNIIFPSPIPSPTLQSHIPTTANLLDEHISAAISHIIKLCLPVHTHYLAQGPLRLSHLHPMSPLM